MNKVAIIGPGLLGGSLALDLRQRPETSVAVWARSEQAVQDVLSGGFADFASRDLSAVVREADLILLCTPVGSMAELAQSFVGSVSPATLITDVGSVKTMVARALAPIFRGRARFVGSHPMAGSEKSGLLAAKAGLFQESVCIVTPEPDSDPEAVREISGFWESLGCRVCQLSPQAHDAMVASISHFPHFLAASLVHLVAENNPGAFEFCGPGFRDTTRVASGPPAMWTEILRANREALRNSTQAMIEKLREIITLLDSESPDQAMHEFLNQAKSQRDQLRLPR